MGLGHTPPTLFILGVHRISRFFPVNAKIFLEIPFWGSACRGPAWWLPVSALYKLQLGGGSRRTRNLRPATRDPISSTNKMSLDTNECHFVAGVLGTAEYL